MFKIVEKLEDHFDSDTIDEISRRLGGYIARAKSFVIEENYVDRDWREEYSIFYSKTFYDNISKFTTRVHMFSEKIVNSEDWLRNLKEENYIGYFVLRPIPIKYGKLLKVLVKPMKKPLNVNEEEKLYLAACEFTPHLGGSFVPKIKTFPFYAQDSSVTVCAHACMWMLTEYMHRKFHLNRPTIRDFIERTIPLLGRVVPSPGLSASQMCVILSSLGYNVSIDASQSEMKNYRIYDTDRIIKRIDAYLESGLPTILVVDSHCFIVAGHTLNKNGKRDYLIYDDSGYFIKQIILDRSNGKKECPFASKVEKDRLKDFLNSSSSFLAINVEFDKLFYPLGSVEKTADLAIRKLNSKVKKVSKTRILLADSNEFKSYMSRVGVYAFDCMPMPHYVWVVEFYDQSGLLGIVLLDASAHRGDFEKHIIAHWFGNDLHVFRLKSKCRVGTYPPVYSNLLEI
ncbi:MAG: papain-like cysteine protease family protein [Archaeoglobaceae archaeon]|nr:papain-like cysteine protease family protein [Archaeoglobales archaeon]MDI9643176.1 papain-like cysteine protease family protein [Archaeoglobales archaeon]